MAYEEGPYIQAACFCDMTIQDTSGALSIIRLIDTITHSATGPTPPEEMPSFLQQLNLVLMFKSGEARGRSTIKIIPELPTGETTDPFIFTVHFDGEEKGANIIARLTFPFEHEGLYWFNVYVNDQKLTGLPLRIKYDRMVTAQHG